MTEKTLHTLECNRKENQQKVLLVTGLSGAGRSSVLRTLEDLGYETIDNLPLNQLGAVVFDANLSQQPLAINVDLRSRYFSPEVLLIECAKLKESGVPSQLVFLESEDRVIERRYVETRRVHPLRHSKALSELVREERLLMAPLKKKADHVIDTSLLDPVELKAFIRRTFQFDAQRVFYVDVLSFAFFKGVPREANFVFDMRFLKNPHYEAHLRALTGEDSRIQDFLKAMPVFKMFKEHLKALLKDVLTAAKAEGRGLFVLAFGCSGGWHRSVAMAEIIHAWLVEQGYASRLHHREL